MPILRQYPSATGTYAKSQLLDAYRQLVQGGVLEKDKGIERRLKEMYPRLNLLLLDDDAGLSEVNYLNRLYFFINHALESASAAAD